MERIYYFLEIPCRKDNMDFHIHRYDAISMNNSIGPEYHPWKYLNET